MIIELFDGTKFDTYWEYDLVELGHNVPSLEMIHDTDTVHNYDGSLILNSSFGDRSITVRFLYEAQNIRDFYSIRDKINKLFVRKESFYISFEDEPYKRWKVKLARGFDVKPNQYMESFEIEFLCVNPFGESMAKTQDEDFHNLYTYHYGAPWDDDIEYTFSTNEFEVNNIGDVPIDPRQHELEIVIKATASSYLEITNNTTGDIYRYNGELKSTDTLTLKGVQSFKNGTSVFKNTNKKLLTLNVGKNNFTITGGAVNSIAFNMSFLYL